MPSGFLHESWRPWGGEIASSTALRAARKYFAIDQFGSVGSLYDSTIMPIRLEIISIVVRSPTPPASCSTVNLWFLAECWVHSHLEMLAKVLEKFCDRVAKSTRQRVVNVSDHFNSNVLNENNLGALFSANGDLIE